MCIRDGCVDSGASRQWSGSLGFLSFIPAFRRSMGVVGVILVHLFHSGRLDHSRSWGPRVHSSSFGRALGVVCFIRVRCVHLGAEWGSFGFIRVRLGGRRVHLGLFGHAVGVAGFIRSRPGCRLVHSGSLGLFKRALAVVVFIRVR